MNRPLFHSRASIPAHRLRSLAASYRLVGRPASVGTLPMAPLTPGSNLSWRPSLLDTLRAPVTRQRD